MAKKISDNGNSNNSSNNITITFTSTSTSTTALAGQPTLMTQKTTAFVAISDPSHVVSVNNKAALVTPINVLGNTSDNTDNPDNQGDAE